MAIQTLEMPMVMQTEIAIKEIITVAVMGVGTLVIITEVKMET